MQLNNKQLELIDQIDVWVSHHFENDKTGHDFHHTKRVVSWTTRLLVPSCNAFVAIMIAYLHDVFDDKLDASSVKTLVDLDFDFLGFDQEIWDGIKSIGYKGGFTSTTRSLEAQIVSDADTLDAMGAVGIARAFYYAGYKGLPFHDPSLEGIVAQDYVEYRSLSRNAIAHFDEKLLKLIDYVKTDKAKEFAKVKHQILLDFYHTFLDEVSGIK